jgi:hypothetical protein
MTEPVHGKRMTLFRESVIFQLKLLADGIRDAVLIPVAMVATIIGLLRGGDEPDREFKRVIDLGKDTERWINLFNHHEPLESAGSMDEVIDRVESVVKGQYQKDKKARSGDKEIELSIKDGGANSERDVEI